MSTVMGGLGNRVLAEIDGTTGVTGREYIWLGDRVIAVAPSGAASSTLYFVTTDHLTRPVQMTNPSKSVVWRAKYGPFGDLVGKSGSASLDARLPGPWFQLESGLAWNWHRHYDASIGRYVQPDPLGLVDGPSVYGYVRQNPMGGVDPEGRFWWMVPIVVGVIVGEVTDYIIEECGCGNQNTVLEHYIIGNFDSIFGAWERKPRVGVAGGSRSGKWTSAFSSAFGKSTRNLGRIMNDLTGYLALATIGYDIYRLQQCCFSGDEGETN